MRHCSTLPDDTSRKRLREWAWDQPCDAGKGKLLLLAICELMPGASTGLVLSDAARSKLTRMTGMPDHKMYPLINGLLGSAVLLRDGGQGGAKHLWPNFQSVPYPEFVSAIKNRPGCVYLLRSNNKYKIGRTTNLGQRVASLATASADDLVLLAAREVPDCVAYEDHLHRHFAGKWIRGEWFRLSGPDIQAITKALGGPFDAQE